jgi:hypothetical protein
MGAVIKPIKKAVGGGSKPKAAPVAAPAAAPVEAKVSEVNKRETDKARRSGAQSRARSSSTTLLGDATTVGQFSSKKLLGQ